MTYNRELFFEWFNVNVKNNIILNSKQKLLGKLTKCLLFNKKYKISCWQVNKIWFFFFSMFLHEKLWTLQTPPLLVNLGPKTKRSNGTHRADTIYLWWNGDKYVQCFIFFYHNDRLEFFAVLDSEQNELFIDILIMCVFLILNVSTI